MHLIQAVLLTILTPVNPQHTNTMKEDLTLGNPEQEGELGEPWVPTREEELHGADTGGC